MHPRSTEDLIAFQSEKISTPLCGFNVRIPLTQWKNLKIVPLFLICFAKISLPGHFGKTPLSPFRNQQINEDYGHGALRYHKCFALFPSTFQSAERLESRQINQKKRRESVIKSSLDFFHPQILKKSPESCPTRFFQHPKC